MTRIINHILWRRRQRYVVGSSVESVVSVRPTRLQRADLLAMPAKAKLGLLIQTDAAAVRGHERIFAD